MTSTAMAAARLLREYAEELKRSHTIFSSGAWPEGESEAKAAYEQHIVIASALEAMPAQCLYQIQEPTGNHSEIPSSSVMPNNCSVAAPAAVAVPDEREAFEAKFKHLDLSRDRDAWMQEKYKHAAISLAWEAWQGRAALAATPADHIADAGKMVENVREGAPYDNPAFEHLARDLGVWGTAQSAICAQFWLAATPAEKSNSVEFDGIKTARPVVLPEPFALYDGEKWYANEEAAICSCADMAKLQKVFIESQLLTLLAGVSAPAAQPERKYICPVRTIADLVNNLMLMDQAMPIYGAQYIERPAGQRRAIAVPPTVSIERVKDSRWIGEGETLNTAIIWTRAEQPAAPQAQADARDADDADLIEWLSGQYLAADFHWGEPKTPVLVIEIPATASVCGDFRTDVRAAIAIAAAKEQGQ